MKSLILTPSNHLQPTGTAAVPMLFAEAGKSATQRYLEFFTANIRNPNTRAAYARAVTQFAWWCEDRDLELTQLSPVIVAAYIEELTQELLAPSIKQHLAAIRMLFDYLVTGQVIPMNPVAAVGALYFIL
jgi:site-specific recombinase XerD